MVQTQEEPTAESGDGGGDGGGDVAGDNGDGIGYDCDVGCGSFMYVVGGDAVGGVDDGNGDAGSGSCCWLRW